MKCNKWFSLFVWAYHDGHKQTWKKVADIESPGLTELAVQAWRRLYGKGCVHAANGKNANPPTYAPTDVYGQSAFDKPE